MYRAYYPLIVLKQVGHSHFKKKNRNLFGCLIRRRTIFLPGHNILISNQYFIGVFVEDTVSLYSLDSLWIIKEMQWSTKHQYIS
jgi:hypothetical protein